MSVANVSPWGVNPAARRLARKEELRDRRKSPLERSGSSRLECRIALQHHLWEADGEFHEP